VFELRITPGAASLLVVALLAAAGCGRKPDAEPAPAVKLPEVPFLKPDEPPSVRPLREVVLMPGEQASVLVVVDRNGKEGPVTAQVKDLPPGITAAVDPPGEKPAEPTEKITLKVAADGTLGDAPIDARASVKVMVNDRMLPKFLKLRVPQVTRIDVPPPQPFLIQPGTTIVWHVPIERHGFEGEIDFQATSSGGGVSVRGETVPAGESAVKLPLAVAADAPDGQAACRLEWTSYGRQASVELPVVIERRPFSLPAVVPITLRRGETREHSLAVTRAGYAGPISLTIAALPEGTRASPPGVTLESGSAAVTFSADAAAREGVAIVPVSASAGHLQAKGLLTVRVVGDTAREILPGDLAASLAEPIRGGGVGARSSPAARKWLANFYGVTDDCGRSAREALRWLAAMQAESGAWQPPSAGGAHDAVALAALAVLPFLAEGITPEQAAASTPATEPFAEIVERSLGLLQASQPTTGATRGAIGGNIESHVFGLIALSEAFALTADAELKTRAKLAVDRLTAFQGKRGEWEVAKGDAARDTAWAVVALQAARACGVGVPSTALRRAANYLDSHQTGDVPPGGLFASEAGRPADAELTAACLWALECAGRGIDSPALAAGCGYLAGKAPAVGDTTSSYSPLFLLFAGEALRNLEGEGYDVWNAAVRAFLTSNQVKDGELAGSWDPAIFGGESDRVWATACAALCLQSHVRSLPLYRLPKKADGAGE